MIAELTRAELAASIRRMIKDQSYRETPIGETVGRYLRWMRNEKGCTEATMRDYEAILARMAIVLHDKDLIEVSTEDLRQVIDLWQERAAKTRAKVTSVIHSFFRWCCENDQLLMDPAARISRPKVPRKVARVLPLTAKPDLLRTAETSRDRLAMFCVLNLGIRRAELANIQVRDFDHLRGRLRVFGKGQKERVLPLQGQILQELRLFLQDDLPHVGRPPQGDDFLMYPVDRRASGKGPEGQILFSLHGRPKDRPSPQAAHRWWYRHAQAAGLVGPGVTSGLNMHRARHTFAMQMRRKAGIDAASQALGHSDLSTTLGIYGHRDDADLETAFDAFGEGEE